MIRDRLWFFTAGRLQTNSINPSAGHHEHSVCLHRPARRYEGKLTYSVDCESPRARLVFTKINREMTNGKFTRTRWTGQPL